MYKFIKVGDVFTTNEGYIAKVLEKSKIKNYIVQLNDTRKTILHVWGSHLKVGKIKNPYHPSIYGRGFNGEGRHLMSENKAPTVVYNKWRGMFERCYDKDYQKTRPTYQDCTVDERWYNFQVFGDWFEEIFKTEYMGGWHLDKDLLIKGNRIYSPETCCLIPNEINTIFSSSPKNDLPTGVSISNKNKSNKYRARLNKKTIGYSNTIEGAFSLYKTYKESCIKELAKKWRLFITDECYKVMINYQVEITD